MSTKTLKQEALFTDKIELISVPSVIGGLCIMTSFTVTGAKYRIENMLASNGEDRALAKMAKAGIEVTEQPKATLF